MMPNSNASQADSTFLNCVVVFYFSIFHDERALNVLGPIVVVEPVYISRQIFGRADLQMNLLLEEIM